MKYVNGLLDILTFDFGLALKMKYYFRLQYTLVNRHIKDFGLHPIAGYFLGVVGFAGLSFYLFHKTELAVYLYLAITLSLILQHGNARRNEFVKSCYSGQEYLQIRALENFLIAAPFLLFLLSKQCFWAAGSLALGAGLAVFLNVRQLFYFSLPTPFYKHPFEFLVGFRNTSLLVFFAYFLTVMSLMVDNFNLGLFSLMLLFLLSLSYYGNPEGSFFVWMHQRTSKAFLGYKVKIALRHVSLLSVPVLLTLLIFYSENWMVILAVQGLGYLYLTCMVLAKYANYPQQISLPQGILMAIGFVFPPLLIGIIPFFFSQSVKRLHSFLA